MASNRRVFCLNMLVMNASLFSSFHTNKKCDVLVSLLQRNRTDEIQ